jgi:hypothetical protein
LSNHSPGLSINWNPAKLGITGEEVSNILWTTEPRIALGGGGGGGGGRGGAAPDQTGISITAYMMMPEDVKVVADRVHEILSAKRPPWKPAPPATPQATSPAAGMSASSSPPERPSIRSMSGSREIS